MFYFIGLFASLALLYKLWPRELDVVSHFYACLTSVMIALSGLRPGTGLGDFDPVQRPAHMAALRKVIAAIYVQTFPGILTHLANSS